jgi:hypothetical protein
LFTHVKAYEINPSGEPSTSTVLIAAQPVSAGLLAAIPSDSVHVDILSNCSLLPANSSSSCRRLLGDF